jgi:hypothetical protein
MLGIVCWQVAAKSSSSRGHASVRRRCDRIERAVTCV